MDAELYGQVLIAQNPLTSFMLQGRVIDSSRNPDGFRTVDPAI